MFVSVPQVYMHALKFGSLGAAGSAELSNLVIQLQFPTKVRVVNFILLLSLM